MQSGYRSVWAALGWHSIVVVAAAMGVAGAAIAALWLHPTVAAAVGASAAAAGGLLSDLARRRIGERGATGIDLKAHILLDDSGRLPKVAAVDAIDLGVHPSETRSRAGLPKYSLREIDDELRSVLSAGSFVLLVGESAAGKSRTAFEALRKECPDRSIVAPFSVEAVPVLRRIEMRRGVLWLDDLERFLGPRGISRSLMASAMAASGHSLVVVATMRLAEWDRFSARSEAALDEVDRASWRAGRDVLRMAHIIRVERRWTAKECTAARATSDDPRVLAALDRADEFGVAELLAVGPSLVDDWRAGWSAGAHPRGAALVAAAVDCRRAGLHEPIGRSLLERLHVHYLREHGGAALRPESLDDALAWVTEPPYGASSLLIPRDLPDGEVGFVAFDYLIDLPELAPVPKRTWEIILQYGTVAEAEAIRWEAALYAPAAYRSAVTTRQLGSIFDEAAVAADEVGPEEAARILRAEIDRQGGDVDVLDVGMHSSLRHQYAFYLLCSGDASAALGHFEALFRDASTTAHENDEWLRNIRHNIASCRRRLGDPRGALRDFEQILIERRQYLDPQDMNILGTQLAIAETMVDLGDVEQAVALLREVVSEYDRIFGPEYVNGIAAKKRLAELEAESS